MKSKKYAIIDIETTGGMYLRDKITEIAIIVTDGSQILKEYQSLINPERSIPYHITRVTGIDDQMVAEAPKFYEVAKEVVEILDGCIFVAHNVNFDYNFIKEEFRSLGFSFNKKKLCTVKLSRSTIPGLRSYGLDKLVEHFDLSVEHRHRAYDDAYATFEIFRYIISDHIDDYHLQKIINEGIDASVLPKGMHIDEVHATPETTGVYYLSGDQDQVLYVGKANNIKKRVFQHFRKISLKSNRIYNHVHKLHYEETGNELIALLLELYEIKRLRPEFNKAMKRKDYPYSIYYNPLASENKPSFIVAKNNKQNDHKYTAIRNFRSKGSAEIFIQNQILENDYCATLFTSRSTQFVCGEEEYCSHILLNKQELVDQFISDIKNEFDRDFIMILQGRNSEEHSFVMIHERRFWGFGYVPIDETITSREHWNDYISYQFWYPEANGIIKNYIAKNKVKTIDT